jgi:hypothetical protein
MKDSRVTAFQCLIPAPDGNRFKAAVSFLADNSFRPGLSEEERSSLHVDTNAW